MLIDCQYSKYRSKFDMENRSRLNDMQVRRVVSQYELGELLGTGSYSEVFKAKHLEEGGLFAIKVISNKVLAQNAKVKEYINNELAIHNGLEPCPYIVRFYELLQTRNNCYFVYEFCEGGTLHEMIKKSRTIDQKTALKIFNQLIKGLKVLRKHNIMHRDLKPENVLIKEGNFKLADFGFCKQLDGQCMTRTMLGSPLYMAPQVLRGEAYSVNADIWSVGVILYEMLYGHCPFQSNSIASLINTIDDTCLFFDPSVTISLGVRRFIARCLQKDCKKRIAWEQLFDEVNKLLEKDNIDLANKDHQEIFSKTMPRVSLVQNLSAISSEEHAQRSTTANKHSNCSKSKYEVFKDNYNKQNQAKSQVTHTVIADTLKGQRSRTLLSGRKSDLQLPDKDKHKEIKITYNQMLAQHEACLTLLKHILALLEGRDRKMYPYLCLLMKGLKRVLEKIYSRINLQDTDMLPVLSIVKYELIQIDKVLAQVEKVVPGQQSGSHQKQVGMPAQLAEMWHSFQQSCPV